MTLLIFYVLLALGFSFLCSIMEAVLLSVTPSFVANAVKEERSFAPQLRKLKNDIDRPLAAILTLNTIAHTVGAAGAGAQAAKVFGDSNVGIISAVLTLLILIFSEIIPKTLGATYWRKLAGVVTRLLLPIMWVLSPFVWLSKLLTRVLARRKPKQSVSREEIAALAEIGERQGVFEPDELRILKNLFRLSSLRARHVMTPRTVVFALPASMRIGAFVDAHHDVRFSRIPLYDANRDAVTGYVLKSEALLAAARGNEAGTLSELKREVAVVPEHLALPEVLELLLDRREHIALVVDEYGGTAGLVTLEDVVETLLGMEIVDEHDSVDDMQELAREQWLLRARRLGIVAEDADALPGEADAAVRLGLTGGRPPQSTE